MRAVWVDWTFMTARPLGLALPHTSPGNADHAGKVSDSLRRGRTERIQAQRSRWAITGIVLVLLAVSGFAVWSSQVTANVAARAATSGSVSQNFGEAASAVAAEESLERKYRLEPRADVLESYNDTANRAVEALNRARAEGTQDQKNLVDRVLMLHQGYRASVHRMFRAVDDGDTAEIVRLDSREINPPFGEIEKLVNDEAAAERNVASAHIASLQRLERITRTLTPSVFFVGLLLVAWLASISRGYRKLLDAERTGALHASMHDSLTGLPNRTLLAERFDTALEDGARTGSATGLLLIDLDRFKEINDTFGHHYGDELLSQIGPRLRAHVREGDTIARLGGDEFAVLLPDVGDLATATVIAGALQVALERSFQVEGVGLDVEASIGIALSGEHGDDATTLLRHVDIAMYVAKSQNLGVFAYDSDSDGHSPERLALLGELRRAIENRELCLHYQPKVRISTGEVIGAEALVRWEHPTRGMIFPDDFIPIAEHTGLIRPLTTYVLAAALAQVKVWSDAGRALPIAVNLSARNLLDDGLPRQVAELLTAHDLPASLLKLEVTESAIMADPPGAARLLRELADLGVEISIDDFGAGYTSLGQLKNLPVTEFKIDKSFVMNMNRDASDAMIVQSVVDLGHNLGLTIVAEGVEHADALAQLSAYGCDAAQGYHLCRPVPAEAFYEWLTNYRAVRVGGHSLAKRAAIAKSRVAPGRADASCS